MTGTMRTLALIEELRRKAGETAWIELKLDNAEATLIDDVKVGFVGRNGAGKSTLLRVLLGEEELDRGEDVL